MPLPGRWTQVVAWQARGLWRGGGIAATCSLCLVHPRPSPPGAFSSLGSYTLSIKQEVMAGEVGICKSQRSLAFLEGGAAPASPASAFAQLAATVPPAAATATAALAASKGRGKGLSSPLAAEKSPKPPAAVSGRLGTDRGPGVVALLRPLPPRRGSMGIPAQNQFPF